MLIIYGKFSVIFFLVYLSFCLSGWAWKSFEAFGKVSAFSETIQEIWDVIELWKDLVPAPPWTGDKADDTVLGDAARTVGGFVGVHLEKMEQLVI